MFQAEGNSYSLVTTGVIVDTNDPQGRGRIRVYATPFGDLPDTPIEDIPWCRQVTPFGGVVSSDTTMSRGPEDKSPTSGAVAYGMWGVPKVGALAVITCLDGDPVNRIWLGCMHPMATEHTMPHGRYIGEKGVDGPVSSTEQPIQPLYSNLRTAFGNNTASYEWNTRAADSSVTGLSQEIIDTKQMASQKPDVRHGYQVSRINPDLKIPNAPDKNYDPQVYSWVSPGFHAVSMEDSPTNCRLKIRTATGHQILMDDTNERIYISTAEGANWIEFDQDGTIDIYAEQNVSIHSARNINLTAAKSIRLTAGTSIHAVAGTDIRTTSTTETHVLAGTNLRMQSIVGMFQESGDTMSMLSTTGMSITSKTTLNIDSEATTSLTAKGVLNILSNAAAKISSSGLHLNGGSAIKQTAGRIDLNGPAADTATAATLAPSAGVIPALLTNRVPEHEPWARVGTLNGFTHDPKYPYDSDKIGKENKPRNNNWKR